MEAGKHLIKINLSGGIVPAGDLLEILSFAEKAGVENVRFGNRQQMYISANEQQLDDLQEDFFMAEISYEIDKDEHPNIVSSYVTADILGGSGWIREGVYKDVLDAFNFRPKLKINLTDNHQSLVPAFTGNLNFITAEVSNYWYLYIRFPKTNILYCWPSLIYSEDIPSLCQLLEYEILTNTQLFYDQPVIDGDKLHDLIASQGHFVKQRAEEPLRLPEFTLPFYEGFNVYGNQKCWLGVYRRNELFSVKLLKDICLLCQQTGLGQLYTTPWKSVIVKGINSQDRLLWRTLLNKHCINTRHSLNELNWHVEEVCDYGLQLKKDLSRALEDADQRTQNLCFAIKTQPKTELFGSVIIRVQQTSDPDDRAFEVLHTADFNPNTKSWRSYRKDVKENELAGTLIDFCGYYYSHVNKVRAGEQKARSVVKTANPAPQHPMYQCSHCLTIYDPVYGDELNNIKPGTDFKLLEEYNCPTCESPKEDWVPLAVA
jgi:rubredoxin